VTVKLAIVGFGAMGSAIVRGGCEAGVLDPRALLVIEPDDRKREAAAALGCATIPAVDGEINAEAILLAVKPQKWPEVARRIGPLNRETIVVSIMAGVASFSVATVLGDAAHVVRAMPNTACRLRAGITAIASGAGARIEDVQFAGRLFSALGRVVEVDESMMNAVTALSGSGPAYVFLLAEAMEQAGAQMGLDRLTSRTLAYETILGAGRLLTEGDDVVADKLRSLVTSPGGTTAAALEVLFERELPQIVAEAIIAARDRGEELGQ
jgi:pyrroline-5-carboxylate reductase